MDIQAALPALDINAAAQALHGAETNSHTISRRVAVDAGFVPAWAEYYTKARPAAERSEAQGNE